MFDSLIPLARLTIRDPKEGITAVLSLGFDRNVLWPALAVIVALSVILSKAANLIAPVANVESAMNIPQSPLLLAAVLGGLLALTVFCIHYIGRSFGGEGRFSESLTAVVWLQLLLLMAQVLQFVLLAISVGLANFFSLALGVFSMWLFVNFVTVVHGFRSLLNVFIVIVIATFGVGIGLSILLSIVALSLGLDVQNV